MNGACPPSSTDTRLSVGAAFWTSIFPIAVEPVKVSLRTSGDSSSASPTSAARRLVTMLMTPAGRPASRKSLSVSTASRGVCAAGLRMAVQPAATAGASLRVIIEIG